MFPIKRGKSGRSRWKRMWGGNGRSRTRGNILRIFYVRKISLFNKRKEITESLLQGFIFLECKGTYIWIHV